MRLQAMSYFHAALLWLVGFAVAISATSAGAQDFVTPDSIATAKGHLEFVLGYYDPKNQMEWRLPTEFEYESQPDPAKGELLTVFKGMKTVSLPFDGPDAVCFDEIWQWEREVYQLGANGEKKLTHQQRSHNVTRYSLRWEEGQWLCYGQMLSNGVHNLIDKPAFYGTVKWFVNGMELVGDFGVGRPFGPGGGSTLGVGYGNVIYTRGDDELTIESKIQYYELAKDAEANARQMADFQRPLGAAFEVKYVSEPRKGEK